MKTNIVDIDAFISKNNCKSVKNPIFFTQSNIPTDDGLFSTDIFGEVGTPARSTTFGYMELNDYFIHPVAYNAIIKLDRKFIDLFSGNKYFSINSKGLLEENEESGETGIRFFYDNFEKIKWKKTDSKKRDQRINFMKNLTKKQVFLERFLIIPAGLRDYNLSASTAGKMIDTDEINDTYSTIIRNASTLSTGSLSFVGVSTRSTIQNSLMEVYANLTGSIKGKNGIIHKGLLGKTVDYATRSVISSPKIDSEKYDEMQVKFGYAGIPLSQLCTLFYPFFIKYITDFIEIHKDDFSTIQVSKTKTIEIDDIEQQFDEKAISKLLNNYIANINDRFTTLMVKDKDGKKHPVTIYRSDLGRNFTITDLLFLAATDITEDKRVLLSRYPVESINNIMPVKVKVLSTRDVVKKQKLDDRYLEDYPLVIPDYPIETEYPTWLDATIIHNSYAASLGADYDG